MPSRRCSYCCPPTCLRYVGGARKSIEEYAYHVGEKARGRGRHNVDVIRRIIVNLVRSFAVKRNKFREKRLPTRLRTHPSDNELQRFIVARVTLFSVNRSYRRKLRNATKLKSRRDARDLISIQFRLNLRFTNFSYSCSNFRTARARC